MPRNVRNFWIQAHVEGRATEFAAGPRSKEGGFSMTIKQRDEGAIKTALQIVGVADANGRLRLVVYKGHAAEEVLVVETRR